jgi:uncharacterized protein YfaS (alpha-2-macroglobulin family)
MSTPHQPLTTMTTNWHRSIVGCLLAALLLMMCTLSRADDDSDSEFQPPKGAPFFLLTDASYASTEEAKVRLEAKGDDLAQVAQADGAEVTLYRVERPLDFLKQQRNLHRIDLKAAAKPEGLANTLSYLWDQWWQRARQIWQNVFDGKLRVAVTKAAPQLKTSPKISEPTAYVYQGAYKALPGLKEVSRMRYPLHAAKPIAPPKDLKLDGSSSNFSEPKPGNVYIPLGKQAPGLYVVEAAVGRHRAVTLLFVSNTLAVTKTAANQFMVWTAQRQGGQAAAGANIVWSDLNGVLGSGQTDRDGVLTISHSVPETSYAFGQDAQGGVFITENFYYDSEIYNNKLYAYTDRPLYRPGDEVNIRLYGREFQSATQSKPMAAGPVDVSVLDATGAPVYQGKLNYLSDVGATTAFTLPANAPSGGYEIVMTRGEDQYSAAFRVAPYVKPHFEIQIEPAQPSFKTGQELKGRIRLNYPDGQPVKNAQITLSARAQTLTMVDGDLAYGGLFPVEIDNKQELSTDSNGTVNFKLPALKEASKLILTALASDGAAQRVRSTKDLLIERSATAWRLQPARQFASPKEGVVWSMSPSDSTAPIASSPSRWVAIHQESQSKQEGALDAKARDFTLQLTRPGSYTIELRDEQGQLLGAAPFYVSGGELKPPQGAIEIVMDKPRYRAGDIAKALITFPVAVKDALLTLERDQVEAYGRLQDGRGMASLRQLNDRQWEASIVVRSEHAPNITFSVAYVMGAEFGFQNAGIVVEQPTLQVSVKPDRSNYLPGDTVTLDINTRNPAGEGVSAVLSVATVDDMVYALQPELAPSVQEFFYHLRRNNVRTHSSLSFISYDEAVDPRQVESIARGHQERGVKVLERPRRDERDTAYFASAVTTDAQGHAQVRFTVPDALTRWRITAKGYGQGSADGLVGEKRAYVQSDKPFFARWTSSTWLREGDQAQASITLFNQTAQNSELKVSLSQGGQVIASRTLQAHSGANQMSVPLPKASTTGDINIEITQAGKVVDRLQTRLNVAPAAWLNERLTQVSVPANSTGTTWRLPPDARDLRVRLMGDGAAAWSQVADGLIDYPYGCVEQTASRMIPLALALQSLPGGDAVQNPLRQRLYAARLRLAAMSGPDAVFGWWGHGTADNAFLSAYAYHADFMATQTLGMKLPDEHWARLLDIYSKQYSHDSLGQRAWTLWMMQAMGLPTGTMTDGLINALLDRHGTGTPALAKAQPAGTSFGPLSSGPGGQAMALVVAAQLAQVDHKTWPEPLKPQLEAAYAQLEASPALLPQAALVWAGRRPATGEALLKALQQVSSAEPTVDRALALSILAKTAAPRASAAAQAVAIKAAWQSLPSASGQPEWRPAAGTTPVSAQGDVSIEWAQAMPQAATLSVRYLSSQAPKAKLPVTLLRKLYRLEPQGNAYKPVAVDLSDELNTQALYLDEVTITITSTASLSHALVELALPPGAMLETSTWGIALPGAKAPEPMARAVGEATAQGYVIPLDQLDAKGPRVIRHLIRLGQKGQFKLPAARLWRMYQADAQATEAGPAVQTWRLP